VIVYVESNFVLEITLGQEQTQAAERILELAESKSIILAFPGFALSEPFATLTHRGKEQLRLSKSLSDMLWQLKRSAPHQASSTTLSAAPTILASIVSVELSRLQTTTQRLLDAGEYLPLQGAVFREATLYQSRYGLSPQDSVIYQTSRLRAPGFSHGGESRAAARRRYWTLERVFALLLA
jgi:predicted nucleic acid-binding protein